MTSGAATSADAEVAFGIDIGGTKVLGIALGPLDTIVAEARVPTPAAPAHPERMDEAGDAGGEVVHAIADVVAQLDAAHIFPRPIVTQIVPLIAFYPGEDYHQDYAIKNPHNPYIQVCDLPKIAALGQQFPHLFQEYIR